jgi:hypothetical protein
LPGLAHDGALPKVIEDHRVYRMYSGPAPETVLGAKVLVVPEADDT